ncbi:TPA: hypothetical protein QCK11_004735 [Enterobacter asburiae]|nr:hypothetical protein [Enterobacter asburiae]
MTKRINKNWEMFDPTQWDITEVNDGNYSSFIYIVEFPNSDQFYIGKKSVFKGVKDISKLKPTSIETDWQKYTTSSRIVNEYIDDGMEYTKKILWCFGTDAEASIMEAALISIYGFHRLNLNFALIVRTKFTKQKHRNFEVLQDLVEMININIGR